MFEDITDDLSTNNQVEDKEQLNKWILFYRQRSRFSWKRQKGKWSSVQKVIFLRVRKTQKV
jgi:hypothetical protein